MGAWKRWQGMARAMDENKAVAKWKWLRDAGCSSKCLLIAYQSYRQISRWVSLFAS